MKKMLAAISMLSISASAGIGSLSGVVNTTNINHLNLSQKHTAEFSIDQIAEGILLILLADKVTDGATLKSGDSASEALPLLWNTIDGVKHEAMVMAQEVPIYGPQVRQIVEGVNKESLTLKDPNQTLIAGNNIIPTMVKIGNLNPALNMILINVK